MPLALEVCLPLGLLQPLSCLSPLLRGPLWPSELGHPMGIFQSLQWSVGRRERHLEDAVPESFLAFSLQWHPSCEKSQKAGPHPTFAHPHPPSPEALPAQPFLKNKVWLVGRGFTLLGVSLRLG